MEPKYTSKFQLAIPIVRNLYDFFDPNGPKVAFSQLYPQSGRSADSADEAAGNELGRSADSADEAAGNELGRSADSADEAAGNELGRSAESADEAAGNELSLTKNIDMHVAERKFMYDNIENMMSG